MTGKQTCSTTNNRKNVVVFIWYLPFFFIHNCGRCLGFAPPHLVAKHYFQNKDVSVHASKQQQENDRVVVAVLGGDLAGVVAACTAAQQVARLNRDAATSMDIWLLTGHSHILEGLFNTDAIPILPDVTLENRQLIECFGNGGKELAGIMAKKCTPFFAKEWLEDLGILLQEVSSADSYHNDMAILVKEKPLFVNSKCNVQEIFEQALENCKVKVHTNVKGIDIAATRPGFSITTMDNPQKTLQADVVILAGDYSKGQQSPILSKGSKEKSTKTTKKFDLDSLVDFDDEEPLSLKDQMLLEKKQQKQAKKQRLDELVDVENVDTKQLSKQDFRQLAKKRKKEAKKQKQRKKSPKKTKGSSAPNIPDTTVDAVPEETSDNAEAADDIVTEQPISSNQLYTTALASKLGHTFVSPSPGMFDFLIPSRGGILDGCSKALIPKARLRCKVENPPKGGAGRLPKLEGPLLVAQGEVSGPAALRLSTLIAHELANSGYRGTLQLHLAPDIGGVEELEQILLEVSEPSNAVLKSPCPLIHREVDYDDYDFEAGDFRSVEFPMVPDGLWRNLCQQAGITASSIRWKDLSPATVQTLARLMVDCSFPITGIRPCEDIAAGGVNLKDVDMTTCQSRLVEGLFLCGPDLDVHGFDGGYNALASVATGKVAGESAVKRAMKS